jgi:hypothetical protein
MFKGRCLQPAYGSLPPPPSAAANGFYIHGVLLCRDGSRFIPKLNAVEQLALFAPRYLLLFTFYLIVGGGVEFA